MAKVTLLAHTPNPEATVAAAAKLCYSPSTIDSIKEGLTPEKTAAFVEMLSEIGHESPIEHVSFTFGVEGISRACSISLSVTELLPIVRRVSVMSVKTVLSM